MPDFRPFNLGEAISAGQELAFNRYRLGETERGVQARAGLEEAMRTGDTSQFEQKFPIEAQQYGDIRAERRAKQLEQDRARLEDMHSLLVSVKDQPSLDMALQAANQRGFDVSQTPRVFGPEFQQYQQMAITDVLGVKGTIEMQLKEAEKIRAEQKLGIEERRAGAAELTAQAAMRRADAAELAAQNKEGIKTPGKRFDVKLEEHAAKQYVDMIDAAPKIQEQGDMAEQTLNQFLNYSKNKIGGTGPFATWGGTTRFASEETQALETAFKGINLKNMVATFQGMSRAVDSNVERRAWEQTQPSISLDDDVNTQILVGNIALSKKSAAEMTSRRNYMDENGSLKGYESPILGKTMVVFDQNGQSTLIEKEQLKIAKSQGFMTSDEYAKKLMGKSPSESETSSEVDNLLKKYGTTR